MPDDLAKLTNVVKNEVFKKTDFSADDYVKKTKFSGDINSLNDKIDKVEKKIPDVSSLETKRNVTTLVKNLDNRIDALKIKEYAKKTSLSNYMLTRDFNTKSTDLETKINANGTEITSLKSTIFINIYLFLFVAVLIVAVLVAAGFIYYCIKDNSAKVDKKIYDVAYYGAGTLNF